MFLAVTLYVKFILFQRGDIFSNKIFDPFLGGLGNSNCAGDSLRLFFNTHKAAKVVEAIAMMTAIANYFQENKTVIFVKVELAA